MKEKIISNILQRMQNKINNKQLEELKIILIDEFSEENEEDKGKSNEQLKKLFIDAKRLEGCSDKTILYYVSTIETMITKINKSIVEIETEDLRTYLSKKVKAPSIVKETYTDEELETMRDNVEALRDLVLIDILASTGMRVGELVKLNIEDINFTERECIVLGKGNKERVVYFDARTKIHLKRYLENRKDNNKALLISLKAPYNRLSIAGVELRLRKIGEKLGIKKVHPHKFRRTLATIAIDKGMPIEQVQKLLGHEKIDTTLQYAMVKQSNVKIAHQKYIG